MTSNFRSVAKMNAAFGNPKGTPEAIDWLKIRNQCKSIGHEFAELMVALGAAVQAAAVLAGCDAATIAAAWGLRAGTVVEPTADAADAAAVRAAFAHARGDA